MTRNNFFQRLKGSGGAPAERDPKLAKLLGRFARAAKTEEARREDAEDEEREARKPRALPFVARFGRRRIN